MEKKLKFIIFIFLVTINYCISNDKIEKLSDGRTKVSATQPSNLGCPWLQPGKIWSQKEIEICNEKCKTYGGWMFGQGNGSCSSDGTNYTSYCICSK